MGYSCIVYRSNIVLLRVSPGSLVKYIVYYNSKKYV